MINFHKLLSSIRRIDRFIQLLVSIIFRLLNGISILSKRSHILPFNGHDLISKWNHKLWDKISDFPTIFRPTIKQYSLTIGFIFLASSLSFWAFNRFLLDRENGHAWFYEELSLEDEEICERDGPSPLVIISFDGLAEEYLHRGILKNLDLMAVRGVKAEHVKPVFPSKTLPNHYTMVTGLYPGYHGIIENWIHDPNLSPDFVDVRKTNLYDFYTYGGEPIWATYRRQTGKRVSCLFYPGCYHYPYHRPDVTEIFENVPMEQVFSRVIGEILKPKELRPGLVVGYINEPDETRHLAKHDSPEVTVTLERLEAAMGTFFNTLHRAKRLSCTNVVFISDHGFINQDRVVNASRFPISYDHAFGDAIARYYLPENGPKTDKLVEKLDLDHQRELFRAYNRTTLPPRFHYTVAKRVGNLILMGAPGTRVGFYPYPKLPRVNLGSNHGWDYLLPEMNTIFFAMGPAFKRGSVVPPFQVIEYYNLFSDILQIEPEPNNGTRGIFSNILKEPNQQIDPLYKNDKKMSQCSGSPSNTFPLEQSESQNFCYQQIDDSSLIISSTNEKIVLEIIKSADFKEGDDPGVNSLAVRTALHSQESLHFSAHETFLSTFWSALEKKTRNYIQRFDRLLIISGRIKAIHDQVDTYFFRIFIRCDGWWSSDGFWCQDESHTKTIAFLVPYPFQNFNHFDDDDLLLEYTARIRDIEVLSGLRLFKDNSKISYQNSIQKKTFINTVLW